jgi:hypothetical protein
MPQGKPSGARCVQLTPDNRCRLYGRPERPAVCVRLRPDEEMCGQTTEQALAWLYELERATCPIADQQDDSEPGVAVRAEWMARISTRNQIR